MLKIAFHNLGCKVNSYETEQMIHAFSACGYEIVPFDTWADVYIVNTCTVTNIADRKSRQMLHRAKKQNPDALVVAAGCYVEADAEKAAADPAVDLVVGNDGKKDIVGIVLERLGRVHADIRLDGQHSSAAHNPLRHTRAFLKIQDGCNQFCSYCLIPYVRGRIQSRQDDDVAAEAKKLVEAGYKEIVLTGIHLSSYGMDRADGGALLNIIERIAHESGVKRIRLGSLEPRIVTEESAKRLADIPQLCPHFHLSLQSGCDATLKRMNRHYTTAEYEKSCMILRKYFEHPAITTDVIVGFPGETEEEFDTTYRFLKRICLYETHIFKYSRRAGTAADRMDGQVPESKKTERSSELQKLNSINKASFIDWYKGRTEEVLLEEEEAEEGARYMTGYTREYVRARIPALDAKPGDIVKVKL